MLRECSELHSDQNLDVRVRRLRRDLWCLALRMSKGDTTHSKRGLEPSRAFYCSSRTLLLVKPLIKKQYLRDNKFSVITMGTTNDFIRVEKL